jgi:hypothetical protein
LRFVSQSRRAGLYESGQCIDYPGDGGQIVDFL